MTLTAEQLNLIFEIVGMWAAICAFVATVVGWLATKALELVAELLRKRGARAPFAERAAYYARMKERVFVSLCRIHARNEREAARRG